MTRSYQNSETMAELAHTPTTTPFPPGQWTSTTPTPLSKSPQGFINHILGQNHVSQHDHAFTPHPLPHAISGQCHLNSMGAYFPLCTHLGKSQNLQNRPSVGCHEHWHIDFTKMDAAAIQMSSENNGSWAPLSELLRLLWHHHVRQALVGYNERPNSSLSLL